MNTILDYLAKIKGFWALTDKRDYIALITILAVSLGSYGLGKLSGRAFEHEPVVINLVEAKSLEKNLEPTPPNSTTQLRDPISQSEKGQYVGSRNGSKYHLPWCSGAQRIKEENKVWFADKNEAKNQGYTPAKNCKGI